MNILVWKGRRVIGKDGKKVRVHHQALLNSRLEVVILPNGDGTYGTPWNNSFVPLNVAKDRVRASLKAVVTRRGAR